MKRFAFLRLEHNANKVIFDTVAANKADAVEQFKQHVTNVDLDADGYAKVGDVSYCVAEYWEPFHTV